MLMTDLAIRDMKRDAESWWSALPRIARAIWRSRETAQLAVERNAPAPARALTEPESLPGPPSIAEARGRIRTSRRDEPVGAASGSDEHLYRWRRHPQLRRTPEDGLARSMSPAVRGVALARNGRCEDAGAAFALAAREEACDISATPGFWSISRRAMVGAVVAYEEAGRFRDAAALEARIRTTCRPRALAPLPAVSSRGRTDGTAAGPDRRKRDERVGTV